MKGLRVRVGMGLVVGLALCVVGASGAWALGLSLTGDPSWSLSNISPESINVSGTEWTVQNTGDEAEDISISAAGSTTWTAADATDVNKFILKHNAYGTYKPITDTVSLTDNLPWESGTDTKTFHLQFTAPTSGSDASQSITVTLSAHNQWYSGPIATDVAPNYGIKPSVSGINVIGGGFESGATVRLKKAGETSIEASSTTFDSSSSLTADFVLSSGEGIYTIEVENPTGDVSPAKTEEGIDCFFGVAPNDATNWTTDASNIVKGVKAGSSGLTTLEGTYEPPLTWGMHTASECETTNHGDGFGVTTTVIDNSIEYTLCKFTGTNISCPAGWLQAEHWQAYDTALFGGDACGRFMSSGPDTFSNIRSTCISQGTAGVHSCSGCAYYTSVWHPTSITYRDNPTITTYDCESGRKYIGCY